MGVSERIERRPSVESDIIIGVIDSGIWPESESFKDEGLGPIPKKWKGGCHGGKNFTCNKKVIGARCYGIDKTDFSARDENGHGTHVASIAAGREVKNTSFYGLAQGIARGGVPSARLAAYKVCDHGCEDTDILSAFDDAIADGVDIISISLAHNGPIELTSDPIAIGAFHAMEKGILTVNCAGNNGPGLYSVSSLAPWIFTAAASDIDRKIVDRVLLGDGTTLVATSINAFPSSDGESPLVYGKDVTSICSETDARLCRMGCVESSLVHQKVVICDSTGYIDAIVATGAAGCIISSNGKNVSAVMPFPIAALCENDINLVRTYHNSSSRTS